MIWHSLGGKTKPAGAGCRWLAGIYPPGTSRGHSVSIRNTNRGARFGSLQVLDAGDFWGSPSLRWPHLLCHLFSRIGCKVFVLFRSSKVSPFEPELAIYTTKFSSLSCTKNSTERSSHDECIEEKLVEAGRIELPSEETNDKRHSCFSRVIFVS